MKSTVNPKIFYSSPEAASIQTVTGWMSHDGRFWGEDEYMARYCGATHRHCDCGAEIAINNLKCGGCVSKAFDEKFAAMERQPWDGTGMVYSHALDTYFNDWDEIYECSADQEVAIADMQLVICSGNYISEVDPENHCCDDLPEDGEVPDEISEAFAALNKVIREYRKPLSYSPSKIAVDLTGKDPE